MASLFSCLSQSEALGCMTDQQVAPTNCTFITSNVLITPYPTPKHKATLQNFIREHGGLCMIWNVSEVSHNEFAESTLDFVYKGFPNLPLLDLFRACISIQSWINASSTHLSLIHCQASKTRAFLVAACYLRWTFAPCFSTLDAFRSLVPPKVSLSPSNARYLHYFDRVLCESMISFRKLRLRRIELPNSIKAGTLYVAMVGKQVLTGEAEMSEGKLVVQMDEWITHDVVLRYRIWDQGKRKTVFKLMFNTGFVQGLELSLEKDDLDLGEAEKLFPAEGKLKLKLEANERFEDPSGMQTWKTTFAKRTRERRRRRGNNVKRNNQKQKKESDKVLTELFGD